MRRLGGGEDRGSYLHAIAAGRVEAPSPERRGLDVRPQALGWSPSAGGCALGGSVAGGSVAGGSGAAGG